MADGLKDISFRGTFRPAQQRILDAAGEYLADRKIHIVAAPGSGKTILGLELIRRINKRGDNNETEIALRMNIAMDEMTYRDKYDYRVVNDDLDTCVKEIDHIIEKENGQA